ncbi:MAG: polysaccharide deacetylase family protein, partial [Algisphaera sp.]
MLVGLTAFAKDAKELPQPYLDTYAQTFTIEFENAAAAQKAKLAILPMYEGKELAVTCRWDDNAYEANPKVAQMTQDIGLKGTFFLNGLQQKSDATQFEAMGKACLDAGHSLGTHGTTHSPTSVLNPNYLSEEFLRSRILIEQTFNTTVNAHAWAFMDAGGKYFMDDGHALVGEVMFRAGLICSAQQYGNTYKNQHLCPSIGLDYNNHKEKLSTETFVKRLENLKPESEPSIYVMPIHAAWYKDFDSEITQAKTVTGNAKHWYCDISEYSAYRNQVLRTEIKSKKAGKTLEVTLSRPVLRDLNNAIALTFCIEGCKASDIAAITPTQATATQIKGSDTYRFALTHDADQALPTHVGAVFNEQNETELLSDPNFAALQGVLSLKDNTLHWTLENTSDEALSNVRLTFRLPYAYADGVQTVTLDNLAAGETATNTLKIKTQTDDYRFLCGVPFFVLQVDASNESDPRNAVRFYLTTSGSETPLSPKYPKGNFAILGPIPDAQWNDDLPQAVVAKPNAPLVLKDGTQLTFSTQEPSPALMEDLPNHARIVDGHANHWEAEMVLTTGTMMWLGEPRYGHWILRSQISSAKSQKVYLLGDDGVQQVFVNGKAIKQEESAEGWNWEPAKRTRFLCPLKRGANDFVVVSSAGKKNTFFSKQ